MDEADGITRRGSFACLAGAGLTIARPAALFAAAPATLSVAAMRADLGLMRRVYETLHPGLYRYATPREVAGRFEAVSDKITAPLSLGGFYLIVSQLTGAVRCGHTYPNFYNQKRAVAAQLFASEDRLPFRFLWIGDRMIVTADPHGTGIVPGSEVLRVNGRPAGALLAAMLPLARADGSNDDKRRRLLSVTGDDEYETFDIYHSLMFGGMARHTLLVRGPDGRRRTWQGPGIGPAARQAQRIGGNGSEDDVPWWTAQRRGETTILTMNSWGVYSTKWDWQSWLDTVLDRAASDGTRKLVIDLRRNEGGKDCGDLIIARLIDRPLRTALGERLVRYRRVPEALRPVLDTWDRSFDTLGVEAADLGSGFYRLPTQAGDSIQPRGPRFRGAVDVLIGPQNSSATFQFAQAIQRARLGRLVGEPTGGNRRGINGGCYYFVRLPETSVEVDLPLIAYHPPGREPDAGLLPDLALPLTPEAIVAGRDLVMERVLA